jgi:hypothetical protein
MSGGNAVSDRAVLDALIARGHNPTLGVEPWQWNGTQKNLNSFNAVVLLNNYNWLSADMPAEGQRALLDYVSQGGGLVTGEWLVWNVFEGGTGKALSPMLPAVSNGYGGSSSATYVQAQGDPIINNGLPRSFSFNLNNIDGSHTFLVARNGSTVFYEGGLIGWNYLAGRVISFSTLLSEVELANSNYARLFANAVEWAGANQISKQKIDFSIADRGGVSLQSGGKPGIALTGYAEIQSDSGSPGPSGLAILGLRQNNTLVSETTVPASSLIRSGRIYAEINGPVNTGLAIANPGDQPAIVSFFFTAATGDFGSGSTMIPANGQIAAFLNDQPFNGTSLVSGTFTFNSSVPVAVFAVRGVTNQRSEFLTTTLPVVDLHSSPGLATSVFPHFVEGGGWTTQILLVNPTDTVLHGRVEFRNPAGELTPVMLNDQPPTLIPTAVMRYSIPVRGSQKLQTFGDAASVVTGSLRLVPELETPTPAGVVVPVLRNKGITVAESGFPDVPAGSTFRIYAEGTGDFAHGASGSMDTALVIANNSPAAATVSVNLSSLDGLPTGWTGTLSIPGNGQVAIFLKQIAGFESIPAQYRGIARLSSASSVSVVGVRGRYNERNEFLFSVMPPVNEAAAPLAGPLYFPLIVDSGGYTTQLILFTHQPGSAPTGTIQLFSPTGGTLDLALQ